MLDTVEVVARETKEPSAFVKHDFREILIYALQESPTNPRRSFDEAKATRTRAEYSIPGYPRSADRP